MKAPVYTAIALTLIFALFTPQLGQIYLFKGFTPYDYHRLMELVLFGVTSVFIIFYPPMLRIWTHTFCRLSLYTRVFIFAFFVLGIISCIHSAHTSHALLWVGHVALLIIFCIAVASICSVDKTKTQNTFLVFLMFILGMLMLWEWLNTLIVAIKIHTHTDYDFYRVIQLLRFPGYSNPRFLAQVLAFILPFVVLPAISFWEKQSKAKAIFVMLIASGTWQMAWMNQSRALYVIFVIVAIISVILFKRRCIKWLLFQAIAMLFGLVLYIGLFDMLIHLPGRTDTNFMADHRLALWTMTIKLISQHFWLGIGPLNFIKYGLPFNVSHPHNGLLFIAVEWGIPAALIFVWLFCLGCFKWLKQIKQTSNTFDIALTSALIGGTIDAQVSGVLLMPASQVIMAIIIGLMLSYYTANNEKPRTYHYVISWVFTLTALMLITQGLNLNILKLPSLERQLCNAALLHSNKCLLIPSYFGNNK